MNAVQGSTTVHNCVITVLEATCAQAVTDMCWIQMNTLATISMNAVKSLVTSMPPAVTRMVHMNAHVLKDTLAMGLCVKMLMNVVQFWVSVLRGVITL
jgi:hypothetical protein